VANIPNDLLFTEEHEWVRKTNDSDIVEVGITDYAQGELGDVVYVELPEVGSSFGTHDVFGTIEAVKAVSELFSPLAGEVSEVNDMLEREPAVVNNDPYGDGWMLRIRITNPADLDQLLGPEEYAKHIGQ